MISTPVSMCAQIVAPFPPAGGISVVSQSGNLVSSFLNYAVQTGVGIAKVISSGNSAQTGIAEYLEYFAADPDTQVVVAYLEGVPDGRRLIAAIRRLTARKPLVLVNGGVASGGPTRGALAHRIARHRRPRLRRRVPPVRRAARTERRGGFRVGRDARDAAATANLFRSGPFFASGGVERISEYHERQDRRFAEAARDASVRHGKPALSATELVHTDRAYGNAGPLAVKEFGRVCYPSAHRAVEALRVLVDRALWMRGT